ncbi:hypothetical protein SUGI_1178380 [Cryptomeria japonica]|nr:hypothetical protein SUGI_1178380 [Cryptomeria japonica]
MWGERLAPIEDRDEDQRWEQPKPSKVLNGLNTTFCTAVWGMPPIECGAPNGCSSGIWYRTIYSLGFRHHDGENGAGTRGLHRDVTQANFGAIKVRYMFSLLFLH